MNSMPRIAAFLVFAGQILTFCWPISAAAATGPKLLDAGYNQSASTGSTTNETRTRTKKSYGSAAEIRLDRKIGLGLTGGGPFGIAGGELQINFSPEHSFVGGFGTGGSYQSFVLAYRRVITGYSFSPYIGGGFARWYTEGETKELAKSNPGFLAEKFLNESERSSGRFGENLLYPSLGIQYLSLDGGWTGFMLNIEVLLLVDVDDQQTAPSAGLTTAFLF